MQNPVPERTEVARNLTGLAASNWVEEEEVGSRRKGSLKSLTLTFRELD